MDPNLLFIEDFKKYAKKRMPPYFWAFYEGGAVGEQTVRENCEAYKRWRFRPRYLRNVVKVDCSTKVLGSDIPFPICIAPTALHLLACPEAEIATAKAAASLGTGMVQSLFSNCSMEEVSAASPSGIRWCHMQIIPNRIIMDDYVKRAERNGYRGFVITLDQTVFGRRIHRTDDGESFKLKVESQQKNVYESIKKLKPKATHEEIVNMGFDFMDGAESWEDIESLRRKTKLPIVVKGILTEEMALEAIEHNVDGIIVSNHGGRQLDGTFSTIDSLPEVIKAVNGRCDVYLDGGIRKGTDIAKAIALGAKAVFIGRPILWGLACGGEKGAKRVLEILRDEFVTTMQLLGVKSIEELQTTPNLIVHESHLFSRL